MIGNAELRSLLLHNTIRTTKVKAFFDKSEFKDPAKHYYENWHDPKEIIDTAKFIRFNTKKFLNVLIWDFDNFPDFGYTPDLATFHNHFYNITGYEPTWTVKTENGYHVCLHLEESIFLTHKDNLTPTAKAKAAKKLKEIISSELHSDHTGSNKLTGIFRNPTTHKHIFTNKLYRLEDLCEAYEIDIASFRKEKKLQPVNSPLFEFKNIGLKIKKEGFIKEKLSAGFFVGNRNHYLFSYGYKLVFENRKLLDQIEDLLIKENNRYQEQKEEKEVIAIAASIRKLFPTMARPHMRGKLSNELWEKGIHGVSARRSYAGWKTSLNRREKTLSKIIDTLLDLFIKGKTNIDKKELAAKVNKSTKQIKRYQDKYNLNVMVFKAWIAKLTKLKASTPQLHKEIDIRPFVHKEIMHTLRQMFPTWKPSPEVLLKDFERKKEYLEERYRQKAA
jgi:hypothetical protein